MSLLVGCLPREGNKDMKNGTRKWLFCAVLVVLLAGLTGMAAAKELLIGNMQDISGPTSVWGNAVTRGAEIAIEKINAAGGIDGAMLKLVTMDTKANVQEAIKGYNSLVSSGVVAVVGPPVSNIGLALGPIANKAGVLLEGGDSLFVGNAKGYVRLNLAMPRAIIQTGLERMRDAIREEQVKH